MSQWNLNYLKAIIRDCRILEARDELWFSFWGLDGGVKRLMVAGRFASPTLPPNTRYCSRLIEEIKNKTKPVLLFIVIYFELKIANLKFLDLRPHSLPPQDSFL